MKKLSLYLLLALVGMFTTACNDDYTDWADPQHNDAEQAIAIPGFSASNVDVIDLNSTEKDSVTLYKLNTATLPQGYVLGNARIHLTPAEIENAKTSTLSTTTNAVSPAQPVQTMVADAFGLRPVERIFNGHVYVNAIKDGQAVLIDAGTVEVKIIPKAPVIEDAYYYVGTSNNWTAKDKTYKLSNGGADPYENSLFSVLVPVTLNDDGTPQDNWFKIAPKSALDREDFFNGDMIGYQVNGENELTGNFVQGMNEKEVFSFKVGADLLTNAKFIQITLDMLNRTFELKPISYAEYIYEIGENTGWEGSMPLSSPSFDGKYKGFAYLVKEFKFKPNDAQNDWSGDWGQSKTGPQGTLVQEDEKNCGPVEAGYYMMDVDLVAMTWKVTPITTIGIIGDAVNGDTSWKTEYAMTYNSGSGMWEITTDLTAGKFKFRANHDWEINWGGTPANLKQKGDNCVISEAGNYTIKLNALCDGKAGYTITKN